MDKALLDTDILSEILKGKDLVVAERTRCYRELFGRYTISTVTIMEVVKGFHKQQREKRIKQFLAAITAVEVLEFDQQSAEVAGRIYADLERAGQPIGRADPMIAAIALRHDLTLVTGNESRYERIQKLGYRLKLDSWRRPLTAVNTN